MLGIVSLAILTFVAIGLVYGVIALHDTPYRIAKARQHPHEDAIQVAGWVTGA